MVCLLKESTSPLIKLLVIHSTEDDGVNKFANGKLHFHMLFPLPVLLPFGLNYVTHDIHVLRWPYAESWSGFFSKIAGHLK